MKLITFLGIREYEPIIYDMGACRVETSLFPVALCELCRPEELLVIVTRAARETLLAKLEQEVAAKYSEIKVTPIDVPDQHSERELWVIFDQMTKHLVQNDEVVFDITYSLRSLPMLVFLATAYLRAARNVIVKGVYYGAYDAKAEGVAPCFNLTPLLSLLSWTQATETYLATGDARQLSALIRETDRQLCRTAHELGEPRPVHLTGLTQALERFSNEISLGRPIEALATAHTLVDLLDKAEPEVLQFIPPMAVLVNKIRQDVAQFAYAGTELDVGHLAAQHRLILWYVDKNLPIQAATLAREWVVTLLCWRWNLDWLDNGVRSNAERTLSTPGIEKQDVISTVPHEMQERLRTLENAGQLCSFFDKAGAIRNDINHAGMRKDGMAADKLFRSVTKLRTEIEALRGFLAEDDTLAESSG